MLWGVSNRRVSVQNAPFFSSDAALRYLICKAESARRTAPVQEGIRMIVPFGKLTVLHIADPCVDGIQDRWVAHAVTGGGDIDDTAAGIKMRCKQL